MLRVSNLVAVFVVAILVSCAADNTPPGRPGGGSAVAPVNLNGTAFARHWCQSSDINYTVIRLMEIVGNNNCTEAANLLTETTRRNIDLSSNGKHPIVNLDPLADLPQVETLNLAHNNLSNDTFRKLMPLVALEKLKTLDLSSTSIQQLPNLNRLMPQLTTLILDNTPIERLSRLPNKLENLHIRYCFMIKTLPAFEDFTLLNYPHLFRIVHNLQPVSLETELRAHFDRQRFSALTLTRQP